MNHIDARSRLISYIVAMKWYLIGGAISGALFVASSLYVTKLIKEFFDATQTDMASVQHVVIIFLLLQLPKGISDFGSTYLTAITTNKIAASLREEVYAHLQRMSLSYFERNKIGHLMSRMSNDITLIQTGSSTVKDAMTQPLMVIGGIASMFYVNWVLALIAIVFAPGMSLLISRVSRRMRRLTSNVQVKLGDVTAILEERLAGIRVVKSFAMEELELDRFRVSNNESLSAALRAARRSALVSPATETFGAIAIACIILAGGYMVVNHTNGFTLGRLFQFVMLGVYVASSVKKLGHLNVVYHQTMAGMDRLCDVLNEPCDIADDSDAVVLDQVEGQIEFRNVVFNYQTGETVLRDVSFTMEPGKVVAIVGQSGSGKSTIAALVPRFYDVSDGAVMVDGHDVRGVTKKSLIKHIGIVPQETVLFSGTIRDNIAYGRPDASDEEVRVAASAANAASFIEQLEDGYDTIIGERGVRLSGGERQRISIARAILKDPKILILDEATSSLDSTSERLVQDALEKLMRGRTTLVIAHRLSTITNADRIIVLRDGEIQEQGSFAEVMALDGIFAGLYKTQYDHQA